MLAGCLRATSVLAVSLGRPTVGVKAVAFSGGTSYVVGIVIWHIVSGRHGRQFYTSQVIKETVSKLQ